jgi:phospholipid/cholesterol/gamma-HCH transport system permease protein
MKTNSLTLSVRPVFRREADQLIVAVPENGVDHSSLTQPLEQLGFEDDHRFTCMRVEPVAGWRWSTADAAFFANVVRRLERAGRRVPVSGLPGELEKLLDLARAAPQATTLRSATRPAMSARIGTLVLDAAGKVKAFVDLLGEVLCFVPRFIAARARIRRSELIDALADSSSRALAIVAIVNVLMGAILAFVGAVQLKAFGAGIYVADLVGIASVRELTPIITAIVLAGRTGAGFAAHIATMQANEEIDALTTLGISPVEFLVLPRVVALSLLMPLLYVYGCAFALLGGLLVAMPVLDLSPTAYIAQTQHAIAGANFAIGVLKALVFGGLVALVGCYCGLRAPRSAAGVGAATTAAVVTSIIGVIVLDAVFAVCAHALGV